MIQEDPVLFLLNHESDFFKHKSKFRFASRRLGKSKLIRKIVKNM